ncbi:MAG: L,D-transpeptidase [Deltaproteobacteria bacterium]|nr:L,D-transpeptidase [Deltaproteobacteria bacterium]
MSITAKVFHSMSALLFALGSLTVGSFSAFAWDEDIFYGKTIIVARPFFLPERPGDLSAQTIIGSPRQYTLQRKDTLLDIARYLDLGYNEVTGVYPDMDPWLPPFGETIQLPTFWILPQSGYEGIVVNIPEMRLYYFPPRDKSATQRTVVTLPVGLGREDWPTPVAKFKVNGKTPNPVWVIPDSIKKERIAEKGWTEDFIPAGSPDNPMGKYRIDLTLPLYKIHDTNNPWAVGRLVTHGCIRMYPEDIQQFFNVVRVGSAGEFVYQPVKLGILNGKVYAEVHEDIYKIVPDLWQEAQKIAQANGLTELIDPRLLLKVLMAKTGMPTEITKGSRPAPSGEFDSSEEGQNPQPAREPQDVDVEKFTNDDLAAARE